MTSKDLVRLAASLLLVGCGTSSGSARPASPPASPDRVPDGWTATCDPNLGVFECGVRSVAECGAAQKAHQGEQVVCVDTVVFQVRHDRRVAVQKVESEPRCQFHDDGITCTFATREECDRFYAEVPGMYRRPCGDTPTQAMVDVDTKLKRCQAAVDRTLAEGRDCWNDRELWKALGIEFDKALDVQTCLQGQQQKLETAARCVAMPEASDTEVVTKRECLDGIGALGGSCGPLHLDAAVHRQAEDIRLDDTRKRIAEKAVKASAREQERITAADAKARAILARCHGSNVIQLVVALQLDTSITPASVKGCTYSVAGMVATTTRDGWVIVTWDSHGAAFKTRKRVVDGAFLRESGARFIGVQPFDRVDGGSASLAAFTLP